MSNDPSAYSGLRGAGVRWETPTAAGWAATLEEAEAAARAAEAHRARRPRLVDPAELIGAQDVCRICGFGTRKSIGDHGPKGFPAPVASVSGTRLWVRTDVEEWQRARTDPGT